MYNYPSPNMIRNFSPSPLAAAISPLKTSIVSEFNILQEKSPKENIIYSTSNSGTKSSRNSFKGYSSGSINVAAYSSAGCNPVENIENQWKSHVVNLERELNREQEKNMELSKKVKDLERVNEENKSTLISTDLDNMNGSKISSTQSNSLTDHTANREIQKLKDLNEEQERRIRSLMQENFKVSSDLGMKTKEIEKFRMKEFSENKALQDCEYKVVRLTKENDDLAGKINGLKIELDVWRRRVSEEAFKSQEVGEKLDLERELAKKLKIDLESKLQILLKENERLHLVMRERLGEVTMESNHKVAKVSNEYNQLDQELRERITQNKILKKKIEEMDLVLNKYRRMEVDFENKTRMQNELERNMGILLKENEKLNNVLGERMKELESLHKVRLDQIDLLRKCEEKYETLYKDSSFYKKALGEKENELLEMRKLKEELESRTSQSARAQSFVSGGGPMSISTLSSPKALDNRLPDDVLDKDKYIEFLDSRLKVVGAENAEINQRYADCRERFEDLFKRNSELMLQLREVQEHEDAQIIVIEELKKKISFMVSENEKMTRDLANTEQNIMIREREYEEKYSAQSNRMEEILREKKTVLDQKLSDYKTFTAEIKKYREELQRRSNQEIEQSIRIEELNRKIYEQEILLEKQVERTENVKSSSCDYSAQLNELEKKLEMMIEDNDRLRAALSEKEEALRKISSLELEEKINILSNELEGINKICEVLKEENQKVNEEKEELTRYIQSYEDTNSKLNEEKQRKMEEKLEQINEENNKLNSLIKIKDQELKSTKDKLSSNEQELTRLRIISIDESKPNSLNSKIEQLIEENEKLTDTLREKKIEVQELKLKLLIQQEDRDSSTGRKGEPSQPANQMSGKERQNYEDQIKQLSGLVSILKEERDLLIKKIEEITQKDVLQSIPEDSGEDESSQIISDKIFVLLQENEKVVKNLEMKEQEIERLQQLLAERESENADRQRVIENLLSENGSLKKKFEKKKSCFTSKQIYEEISFGETGLQNCGEELLSTSGDGDSEEIKI